MGHPPFVKSIQRVGVQRPLFTQVLVRGAGVGGARGVTTWGKTLGLLIVVLVQRLGVGSVA